MLENNKLEIFENFVIDHYLPKFQKNRKTQTYRSIDSDGSINDDSDGSFDVGMEKNAIFNVTRVPNFQIRKHGEFFLIRFLNFLMVLVGLRPKTLTVEKFFKELKGQAKTIEIVQDRISGYK